MKFLLLPILSLLSFQAAAQVEYSGKHAVFLHASVDKVVGSYMFVITNTSSEPQRARIPLMLPEETDDWRPQEGVAASELEMTDGGLVVDKEFASGESYIAIDFLANASGGATGLTFKPAFPIMEFAIYSPKGEIDIKPLTAKFSPGMDGMPMGGKSYNILTASAIDSGEKVQIEVSNIPEGRANYWLAGSTIAGLLVGLASLLAWRTKPHLAKEVIA
jgi:hypothetical protein